MGTKHIRHLVTELAARLSDRDFLRKAGISRRTMQEIFVRDKWEEALESLFPIRERLSCKQILELCHPELWALSGEPEEGWISFTYKPVFRRSTRKVPSFSSRHFFISFPASRFFLYLQQIFNALLGLFLLKKFF